MIPNVTVEQLASQARLERRAAGILEAAQARRTAAAGRALARRPDLTDLAAAPRCHQRVTDLPTHVEWHTVRIEGRPRGPHPGPFAPPGFELMGTPDQVLAPRRLFQPPGAVDGMEDQP